jgi:eukaryotic-like serine/threonine-protein kinase
MSRAEVLKLGRYVLHSEIASGGMASVHFGRLAGAGGFQKTVAIKRLHPQFARDPDFRNMILEEARLAARIRHPNVVQPLDVLAEQGELLLVMEYVHGESLSRVLRAARQAGERVPLPIAVAIMSNVLHGLHAAHEAKDDRGRALDIVHRDISPQNVIVGVDGVARVIDFGIAKAATSHETTRAGTVKGKVPYLAPEQLSGEVATRLTDVYAAGVMFWEMLAGQKLFEADNDQAVVHKILNMPVAAPSRFHPEVTETINDIVLTAIARDPRDRFDTARDMALALEEIVQLATPTSVGQWVEANVADQIAWRAEQLAAVDGLPSQSAPPAGSAPPTARVSSAPSPPVMPETVKMSGEFRRALSQAPPRSQPQPASQPQPPRLSAAPRPPAAGELRKPAVEIPNVEWMPTADHKYKPVGGSSRRSSITLWLLGILVLLAVAFYLFLPKMLVRGYAKDAAKHNVTLGIEDIELSRSELVLKRVTATSAELPGVELRVGAVRILMTKSFETREIVLVDAVLDARGTYAELATRYDKYRGAHASLFDDVSRRKLPVHLESGRVKWEGALGPGTRVDLENVTGDLSTQRDGPLELKWTAPIAKLTVGQVTAGPWFLDHGETGSQSRTTLRFDPTGTNDARVTWSASPDGSANLDLQVPGSSLAELRVPASALGGLATQATKLELRGAIQIVSEQAVGRPPSRALAGKVTGWLSALAVANGWPALDALVTVTVTGDPDGPSQLGQANVTVGLSQLGVVPGATGPWVPIMAGTPAGTLDLSGHGGAASLAARTTARPCAASRGETSLVLNVALPLMDLSKAGVSLAPTAPCPPRTR